jgi:hypothetical protein
MPDELKVKAQVHRYEVTYQRRPYVVERHQGRGGSRLYVYDGPLLIHGGAALDASPVGLAVAQAFLRWRKAEQERRQTFLEG